MTQQRRRQMTFGMVLLLLQCVALRVNGQSITLVGADAQGALKFTTTTRKATVSMPIELEKEAVDDFRVMVDNFVAPDGRTIPVAVTIDEHPPPAKMTIKQVDRPVLSVAADFETPGEYRSRVVLFYGGKRAPSIPLIVTRQLSAISLRVDAVAARTATVYWDGRASARVTVQETAGQTVTIDPPAIVNLAVKRGDKVQQEARYRRVDVRRLDDGSSAPADPCAPSGQKTASSEQKTVSNGTHGAEPFTVEALGHADFLLTLCGIVDAGEYSGTIRVSNRETTAAEKAVTMYVKKGPSFAFAFIFLGVLASYLMRRWTKEEKPRLEAQRRVGDLEEALKKNASAMRTLDDAEKQVFAGLRGSLDEARRAIERGQLTAATAALDVIQRKINNLVAWHNTGRRLSAAEAGGNVATIRARWADIAQTYFFAAAPKDDDFSSAIAAILKSLQDASIDRAVHDVDEFRKRVDAEKSANPHITGAVESDVKPLLDEASKHATNGRVAEADEVLTRSKAAFAKVLADALIVALAKPAPIGFTAQQWADTATALTPAADAVRTKASAVKTRADANEAITTYEEVDRRYVEAVLSAAERRTASARVDMQKSSMIPQNERPGLLDKLDEVESAIKGGRAHLANRKNGAAIAQYQEAANTLLAVVQIIQRGGAQLGPGRGGGVAAIVPGAIPAASAAPAYEGDVNAPVQPARKASERITDLIARYDLLLNLGVLLIAAFLGMKLLWADDPVWGGWTSYTVAFLWGLGLQQVGGAGFEGLPALTKKLTE